MKEQPERIAGRLEATLRVPPGDPRAMVVIAHPLPTHGGHMRNPLIAALARACAQRGWYALRFNFRGVGASAGAWSDGVGEPEDVAAAVAHARAAAPGLPLAVCGYSFGALMTLRWLATGGTAEAVVLIALPLRSVTGREPELPPVPADALVVAGERDDFGNAAELRAALPRARIAEVRDADHFFTGRRDELLAVVTDELARAFG